MILEATAVILVDMKIAPPLKITTHMHQHIQGTILR